MDNYNQFAEVKTSDIIKALILAEEENTYPPPLATEICKRAARGDKTAAVFAAQAFSLAFVSKIK